MANLSVPLVSRLRGPRTALVSGGASTSADALRVRTLGTARWLSEQGVRAADRVVLLVPPGPAFAAAFLATVWVGAVPVLIDPTQAPGAWQARLAAARARYVVADPRLRQVWRLPLGARALRRLGRPIPDRPRVDTILALPSDVRGEIDPAPRADRDEALILFTSGTTSQPRGVVHTHGNLRAFLDHVAAVVQGLELGTYLAETPQQIFYALLLDATCHVVAGQGEARVRRTLEALSSGAVRAWFGGPWTWVRWLDEGRPVPPDLRTVLLGSAPVTRPFLRRLLAALPETTDVRCVYGLTEIGPACTVDARVKASWAGEGDLVGQPLGGVDVRLGDDGEVLLRSDAMAVRYLGEGPLGPWLHTGDLGAMGPDGLALRGRLKDMIVRRGINLYPGVLEPLLLEQLDDAALVGVWDAVRQDERVVLAHTGALSVDAAGLLGDAAPDHVLQLEALPRAGRQHKVDKRALRELARTRFGIPG